MNGEMYNQYLFPFFHDWKIRKVMQPTCAALLQKIMIS